MRHGLYTTERLYGDDATSGSGAHRIKQRIERYWQERGYHVHVTLRRLPCMAKTREAAFTPESDLINGLPREVFEQKRGRAA